MKKFLKWALMGVAGALAFTILLSIALIVLDAIKIATGAVDERADATLGAAKAHIAIVRRPIWHPILGNEFTRSLIVETRERGTVQFAMEPDTGGYAMVHVYQLDNGDLLLTDGIFCSRVDVASGRVSEAKSVIAGAQFIGAFDDKGTQRQFRFFAAGERPRPRFDYVHPECIGERG